MSSQYELWQDMVRYEGPPEDCRPHGILEDLCDKCVIDRLTEQLREETDYSGSLQALVADIFEQVNDDRAWGTDSGAWHALRHILQRIKQEAPECI